MSETSPSTRDKILRIALPSIPLLVALLVLLLMNIVPSGRGLGPPPSMTAVTVHSAGALQELFRQHDYQWPPSGPVPPLAVRRFPNDLGELPVGERKSLFFRTLLPMILAENQLIRDQRQKMNLIDQKLRREPNAELDEQQQTLLETLWKRYRVDGDIRDADARSRLLRRLDVIPPSLALAQAANESGWGTSRFTLEANNLFGVWTWDESIGLMPKRRNEGATHFVRIYPSLYSSIRGYMRNLNTGQAYRSLRATRARMRQQGRSLDGLELAGGLERYSERGEHYIREIRSMIRQNNLHRLPRELELEEPGD